MYHLWLIDVGRNQHYTQSNYPPIEINKFLKIKVKKKKIKCPNILLNA